MAVDLQMRALAPKDALNLEFGVSRRVGKIAKLPGSKIMSMKLPLFR